MARITYEATVAVAIVRRAAATVCSGQTSRISVIMNAQFISNESLSGA